MFLWKWIRRILMLIGLFTLITWGIKFLPEDSFIKKQVEKYRSSPMIDEGVKDLKALSSEVIKASKKGVKYDEFSEEEKAKLKEILERELKSDNTNDKKK